MINFRFCFSQLILAIWPKSELFNAELNFWGFVETYLPKLFEKSHRGTLMCAEPRIGGWYPVSSDQDEVKEAAKYIVTEYNARSRCRRLFNLVNMTEAQEWVRQPSVTPHRQTPPDSSAASAGWQHGHIPSPNLPGKNRLSEGWQSWPGQLPCRGECKWSPPAPPLIPDCCVTALSLSISAVNVKEM